MAYLNYGDPFEEVSVVSTTQKQMRDDFVGFDPLKWNVVNGAGDTPFSFVCWFDNVSTDSESNCSSRAGIFRSIHRVARRGFRRSLVV